MKRTLVIAMACAMVGSAHAQLWNNGGMVTHPGAGPGGVDVSMASQIDPPSTAGSNVRDTFRLADNFVVTGPGWIVNSIRTYGYETNAVTPGWTGGSLRIWNAEPGTMGASVIFDQTYTSGQMGVTYTNINRVFHGAANISNTARRIHAINFGTGNLVLNPGTYWIDWNVTGGASGWGNYVMQANPNDPNQPSTVFGDGRQWQGTMWQPTAQAPGVEIPFQVHGEVVPEPGTMIALGAGIAAIAARRRRRNA
jgi:hypothetical protein